MKKVTQVISGIALGTVLASQAFAGSLGATSTDSSVVSLEVVDRVQITNVDDIALGAYSGSGVLSGSTQYCVHRNGGDGYTVTLTTDTGSFQVTSATTSDNITFTTKVDQDANATDGAAINYNTASASMAGSGQVDCGGSDNGAIEVSFAQADLLAASTANDYTATMTILVEPI